MDTEHLARIALGSAEHLKQWLRETGRSYIVFRSDDLIDALPWPEGVEYFQHLVHEYTNQRAVHGTGRYEQFGEKAVEIMKTDALEIDEIDACIEQLKNMRSGYGT